MLREIYFRRWIMAEEERGAEVRREEGNGQWQISYSDFSNEVCEEQLTFLTCVEPQKDIQQKGDLCSRP
jgi:outer membrane biogenesis lipoprotein LolB